MLSVRHQGSVRPRAWLLKAGQGGLPVSISSTVQATDQMSACRPAPVCLITSGAIQLGVPAIDLCPDSAGSSSALVIVCC